MTQSPPSYEFSEQQAAYGIMDDAVAQPARIGDYLLARRMISAEQIQLALHEQRLQGGLLGHNIVRLGFMTDQQLAAVVAAMAGLPCLSADALQPEQEAIDLLPRGFADRHLCLPLLCRDQMVHVAVADPYDVVAMDALRRCLAPAYKVALSVAAASDIRHVLSRLSSLDHLFDQLLQDERDGGLADPASPASWQPPVVRFVDELLADAVHAGASDIHLEPETNLVRLRYRIDGLLQTRRTLHKASWPEISYRIKIMANMNIAETRRMQDGRFGQEVGGAQIDFRISTMPVTMGENIVIRVLDQRRALLPLGDLGLSPALADRLGEVASRPDGLILLTGPTGCGKTTTLYALLRQLGREPLNIMTLEEPVEYSIDRLRQTHIHPSSGLGFADGVRGVLRQDPDVILIGEIRDPDTAQMALRATMTGHRVFSTLHCRDSFSALPRLQDLGLSRPSFAGHLAAVMAQRLVPQLCAQCKFPVPVDDRARRLLAQLSCDAPSHLTESKGCPHCRHTGIKGRVAVAELLTMTPRLDNALSSGASRSELVALARQDGFRTMQEDACDRLLAGDISFSALHEQLPLMEVG